MVDVDWTPEGDDLGEGIYPVEVDKAELRHAGSTGNKMVSIALVTGPNREYVCHDNIMIEGKGRGMGQKKLKAYGYAEGEPVSLEGFKGRRAFAAIHFREWQGKRRRNVDADAKGSMCGYWPADNPPPGFAALPSREAAPAATEDPFGDTPF